MKVKLWRRVFAASMSAVMLLGLTACGGSNSTESSDGVKTFTMFTAMPGSEINDDNDVMNIIAEKTGAKLKETWLTGQTDAEAIGTIIAGGEYPDFINGGDAMMSLYDAGVLVPWDDYLEKYPNLKEMYTDKEWDNFRQEDGKIYWANVFQNTYGEDRATTHNDEAFWIQARVLEWAGYPEIKTLDQYFDLLESYAALGKFDVVFCRNVLIYFSAEVKKDILTRIHATLKPGGYLFLGASEALNGLPDLYQMVQCSPGIIYKVK